MEHESLYVFAWTQVMEEGGESDVDGGSEVRVVMLEVPQLLDLLEMFPKLLYYQAGLER